MALESIVQALLFRLRERVLLAGIEHIRPYTTSSVGNNGASRGSGIGSCDACAPQPRVSCGATFIKVHEHARGGGQSPEKQAVGNCRGGANTKIRSLVDTHGRPLRLLLSAGHRHDILAALELVEGCTQRTILADKAYDSDELRQLLKEWDLKACIPPKANRKDPPAYHKGHYKRRHQVENFLQRIKEKRAIATRYEKLASRFEALVSLAVICEWLWRGPRKL